MSVNRVASWLVSLDDDGLFQAVSSMEEEEAGSISECGIQA